MPSIPVLPGIPLLPAIPVIPGYPWGLVKKTTPRGRLAAEGQAGCPLKAALRYFPSPSERRVGQLGLPAPVGEPSPGCKSAHSFTWYSENHTQVTVTGSEFNDTVGISVGSARVPPTSAMDMKALYVSYGSGSTSWIGTTQHC